MEGKTTLKGGLEVSGGTVAVQSLEATDLVVNGNVKTSTSGSFAGYGITPVGGIIMWSGSPNQIPDGWALCNGQTSNGKKTPDLSGKFVVGYSASDSDYNSVGNTGGEKSVALTAAQMPSHSHSATVKVSGLAAASNGDKDFFAPSWKSQNASDTITTSTAGSGQSHENRPPYFAICFIMRVK